MSTSREREQKGAEALAAARAMAPEIRKRRDAARCARRVPSESISALRDSRLLRAVQPAHYGGLELDRLGHFRVIMELARSCGSTGWVYAVLSGHSQVVALFAPEAQEEVWGEDSGAVCAASAFPQGKNEAVDAGYRIDGRWRYASGCDHADWALLGGLVPNVGMRVFAVPLGDLEVLDDWHVLGLEATGSKSLLAHDLFVPEHRAFGQTPDGPPGLALHPSPIFRSPVEVLHSGLCAVVVGVAEGAVDEFVDEARGKSRLGRPMATAESVQLALGESAAEVQAARLLLENAGLLVDDRVHAGQKLSPLEIQSVRRDSVFATRLAVRAVDRLHAMLGGAAIFADNPLAISFSDVHAGLANWALGFEAGAAPYGQLRLATQGA